MLFPVIASSTQTVIWAAMAAVLRAKNGSLTMKGKMRECIIRTRLKIYGARHNAQAFLQIQ